MDRKRRTHLQIKISTLAAEARIIRKKERSLKRKGLSLDDPHGKKRNHLHGDLYTHRISVVRSEARSANLAYAFLRGVPLEKVERDSKTWPNWYRVSRIVATFVGPRTYGATVTISPEMAEKLLKWKIERLLAKKEEEAAKTIAGAILATVTA